MNYTSPSTPSAFGLSLAPAPFTSGGRLGKIQGYVATIAPLILAGKSLWDIYNARIRNDKGTSLLFREGDDAYQWLLDWIGDHPDRSASNSFLVFESRSGGDSMNECEPVSASVGNGRTTERKTAKLIPIKEFRFVFQGVQGSVNKPDNSPGETDEKAKLRWIKNEILVQFDTRNFEVCVAFIEELQAKAKERTKEPPKVFYWRKYHGWNFAKYCPPTRSVILPDGLLDDLIGDMRRFYDRREWYEFRGIPHRRGYVLYGTPGSGKTSTVLSAANELEQDIYWVQLSGMSDDEIMGALNRVPRGGIVLLEDIDCAFEAREKKEGDESLTFSGLLNALDGVASQEGRIVIMTTNHIERLDPALIRPGRIDRKIEFGNATHGQLNELIGRFLEDPKAVASLAKEWSKEDISMATALERLISQESINQ